MRDYADGSSPEALWAVLRQRCLGFAIDPLAEQAVALLDAADGQLQVGALARQLGVGLRTLQARFLAAVGMSPKEYARVRRLQALLH